MNDFEGLLASDFGFKSQSKSAPMAASRTQSTSRSPSSLGDSFVDDHDPILGSAPINKKLPDFGNLDAFDNIFAGPKQSKHASMPGSTKRDAGFDFESMFDDRDTEFSSAPVYDKPVYDDDIFEGVPGLKSSGKAKHEDFFSSSASIPKESDRLDDLLGSMGVGSKKTSGLKESGGGEKGLGGFDDLIPGFRESSPVSERPTPEARPSKSTSSTINRASSLTEDPFVVPGSTSLPGASSSKVFSDSFDEISKLSKSGSSKADGSSFSRGMLDDIDPFNSFANSVPAFSSKRNDTRKDRSPVRRGSSTGEAQDSASGESNDEFSAKSPERYSQKGMPVDDQESNKVSFDTSTFSNSSHNLVGENSFPPHVNNNSSKTNSHASMPPTFEENVVASDEIWLVVSEIPLFTKPTSAPPPSRPPPPKPPRVSNAEYGRKKDNEFSSFPNSTQHYQGSKSVPAASQIDELEDFAMGRSRNTDEYANVISGEEVRTDSDAAASAAAMKEAMDRAEAKFRHAKEIRERENAKVARSKEALQPERDEKTVQDDQEGGLRERQKKIEREQRRKEMEEEEREHQRLERERAIRIEREKEEEEKERRKLEKQREREIERGRARQAVERATREARERAAIEARLKAERAAVQRIQAEARERAAVGARERAEKAAAEARERVNADAREKEAQEKAAAAAIAEARRKVERAAVERAAQEARERAATAAAAAAASKVSQQKNENDLESFFSARASSAPRPRANDMDPMFDAQSQTRKSSESAKSTPVGTSSSMRKASSTTNIVDDLTSIFGGVPSSGEFQEVEGESEERRRARMERHQKAEVRAARALAEKNQRDFQAQKEQEERHRIAESLDIEIKRWAAGKEGNLRALLSTLQYVLWPECGWQPVSLTDLITGASVKKVYRKATLCIHPDKVQQKGANLQQKYIAEKVFDLLKEAWNKLNSEELF